MPKRLEEFSAADWGRLRPLTQGVKSVRYRLYDHRYRHRTARAGSAQVAADLIRGRRALVTIAFSDPQLLCWQTRLVRRYVPNCVHVIVDNSDNDGVAARNARIVAKAGLAYLRAPRNPWSADAASRSHGIVLNWAWANVIQPGEPEAFGFIDHDIFPTAADDPFAPLATQDIYGVIRRLRVALVLMGWVLLIPLCRRAEHEPRFRPGLVYRPRYWRWELEMSLPACRPGQFARTAYPFRSVQARNRNR